MDKDETQFLRSLSHPTYARHLPPLVTKDDTTIDITGHISGPSLSILSSPQFTTFASGFLSSQPKLYKTMQHSSFPFLTCSGLTPPFPGTAVASSDIPSADDIDFTTTTASTSNNENSTRRTSQSLPSKLLTLIRTLEKTTGGSACEGDKIKSHNNNDDDDDDDVLYEDTVNEVVCLLNHLVALYSRRGLLQGDSVKAERILSSVGTTTSHNRHNNNSNRNRDNNSDLRLRTGERRDGIVPTSSSSSSSSLSQRPQEEEVLIFTSILRLLPNKNRSTEGDDDDGDADVTSPSKSNGQNRPPREKDDALLISLGAELIVAMTQHLRAQEEGGTSTSTIGGTTIGSCILAEYELLAQSGKSLLNGFLNAMQWVEFHARTMNSHNKIGRGKKNIHQGCMALIDLDDDLHIQPLNSTMKATSALISLFGTKLSRSTVLLQDLKRTSWTFITTSDTSVQDSAARLLACLPLAGGMEQKSPSILWTMLVSDTLNLSSFVLNSMAPLTTGVNDDATERTTSLVISDDIVANRWRGWVNYLRTNISSPPSRLQCFSCYTRGLTMIYHFLLLRDGTETHSSDGTLIDAQVPVDKVLDVVESFVSFPLTAEMVYHKTKRRLRDEVIQDGLVSPKGIVSDVANHIKHMGHQILDCTIASMGGSVLLPYGKRIIRISYASLLTSSSGHVRKVLDPTSMIQMEGKKRRWLHLSLSMRTIAIRTMERTIRALGVDLSSMTRTSSTSRSVDVTTDEQRAVTIVIGCLVEQIGSKQIGVVEVADTWGSLAERVEMVAAAAECLRTTVNSCGDYLPIPIRSLLESVTVTGLAGIREVQQSNRHVFAWPSVKVAFLRLASSCLSIPWSDGAISSLGEMLFITAKGLENDMDDLVAGTASTAVRLCDNLNTPRAPALLYISRATLVAAREGTTIGSNTVTTDATTLAMAIDSSRNETKIQSQKTIDETQKEKKMMSVEIKRRREEQEEEDDYDEGRIEEKPSSKKQKIHDERKGMKVDEMKDVSNPGLMLREVSTSDKATVRHDANQESSSPPSTTIQNRSQDSDIGTSKGVPNQNGTNDGLVSTSTADSTGFTPTDHVDPIDKFTSINTSTTTTNTAINGTNSSNTTNDDDDDPMKKKKKEILSMDDEKENDNNKNDDDDDEIFPEILDHGPDSDDE
jgi:hypothetical protein